MAIPNAPRPFQTGVKPMADSVPMSLEELEEYDHETVKLVTDAERLCQAADAEYEDLNATAKAAKKSAEAKAFDLRQLIREREHNRGKRPEATLLDVIAPSKWRERPVADLAGTLDTRTMHALHGVENLGELYQQVHEFDPTQGCPYGLTLPQVVEIRQQLEIILNAEVDQADNPDPPATIPPELWREYPIARWEQFGMTAKDVEKLAAGEVKRETGRRPIVTVGDLSQLLLGAYSERATAGHMPTSKASALAGTDRIE